MNKFKVISAVFKHYKIGVVFTAAIFIIDYNICIENTVKVWHYQIIVNHSLYGSYSRLAFKDFNNFSV